MTVGDVVYADTSALAKLIVDEPESATLRDWLRAHGVGDDLLLVTNTIGAVELRRVAARLGQRFADTATRLLARVGVLELTPQSLDLAANLPPHALSTLDALHVSSASLLADLRSVVAYDPRLLDAAEAWGLPIAAPGARMSGR